MTSIHIWLCNLNILAPDNPGKALEQSLPVLKFLHLNSVLFLWTNCDFNVFKNTFYKSKHIHYKIFDGWPFSLTEATTFLELTACQQISGKLHPLQLKNTEDSILLYKLWDGHKYHSLRLILRKTQFLFVLVLCFNCLACLRCSNKL